MLLIRGKRAVLNEKRSVSPAIFVGGIIVVERTRAKTAPERKEIVRRLSGRNQLVGRIDSVRISGLMAEIKLSIGEQQITSIITATSAREMKLKPGQTAAALIKATEVMIFRV